MVRIQNESEKRPTMALIVSMLEATRSEVAIDFDTWEQLQEYELSDVEESELTSVKYSSESEYLHSNGDVDIGSRV